MPADDAVQTPTAGGQRFTEPSWLTAGRVGRPHGLDGSFYVAEPNAQLLVSGAVITLGASEFTIARRAGTDQRPIVRLQGCESRSAAESLRGEELLVARREAPALAPDEWWAQELEGCVVCDGGVEVGVVRRLAALPSCEVLEVERGAGRPGLLVPLVRDAVRSVDVQRRTIDVDLAFLGER